MQRRDFIKLTAVTGTSAALASCGNPEHQLIRFVPDDEITPGIAEWKPSVCPVCSAGCGVNVRVMDADIHTVRNGQAGVVRMNVAKKLEGQPKDPVSKGGLCTRGQAAIQITYHPDRIAQPLKRDGARGTGLFRPIAWDEAIAELTSKVDALDDKKALATVVRPHRGNRNALFAAFANGIGAPAPMAFELFSDEVIRHANSASYGKAQLPTFDLARARYVISFGADFLGTWGSIVAQNAAYGEMRTGRPGVRGKLVQVEARMTATGACADEWVPTKPGTEGVLALALAGKYSAADAEKITGVPAKKIERLAKEIADEKPAVAIVGGPTLAHTNGLFTAMAVNELNKTLGGDLVGFAAGAETQPQTPSPEPLKSLQSAKLLIVDETNPLYASPKAWKVREALQQIPYIVSFSSFVDDTTAYADLILPDHSFLESPTEAGGPVMRPIHDTRATADVLIEIAGKLKTPVQLPWKNAEELVKSGGSPQALPQSQASRQSPASSLQWSEPKFDGEAAQYPFHFLPYASTAFGDGSTAHLPWMQELPDPLTSAMWSSWIEINPRTADKMGINDGDLVDVTSSQGTLRVPAIVYPGIAPDIVAMPVGQGHEHFTRYASNRGANAVSLLAPIVETETGALAWAATRVKIARAGDADGSLILFAGEKFEKPHDHEIR
jgi:anaerobic selenocysteine-containing dehydrogenase